MIKDDCHLSDLIHYWPKCEYYLRRLVRVILHRYQDVNTPYLLVPKKDRTALGRAVLDLVRARRMLLSRYHMRPVSVPTSFGVAEAWSSTCSHAHGERYYGKCKHTNELGKGWSGWQRHRAATGSGPRAEWCINMRGVRTRRFMLGACWLRALGDRDMFQVGRRPLPCSSSRSSDRHLALLSPSRRPPSCSSRPPRLPARLRPASSPAHSHFV